MSLDVFSNPDSVVISGPVNLTGNLTVTGGGIVAPSLSGGVSSDVATVTTDGTISVSHRITAISATDNVNGVILAPGTQPGQDIILLNESNFSVTFASAESNVATGATTVIPATSALRLVWNSSTALWYHVG